MTWFGDFYRSTLGKKAVMAVTGIIFWGFVLGHMLGNLKLFLGAEALNTYAHWLREVGYPGIPHEGLLWIIRLVLLAAVSLHVHAALTLTLLNRRARPQDYADRELQQIGWAERSMRVSGILLIVFIVFHILHFTTGQAHHDFQPGNVYGNVVSAFHISWMALIYVVAMALLGLHLYHGLWSLFQSLGWNHPRFNPWRRAFAVVFAILISLGFMAVPLAVMAGIAG